LIDVVHAAAFGFFGYRLLSLLLSTDKENSATIGGKLLNELVGLIEACDRLLQVNDMDAIAIHKDEWLHFGVPATGLVPEVYAGLQQLLHRDNVCQKVLP